jgi:hypothetical protein
MVARFDSVLAGAPSRAGAADAAFGAGGGR